MITITLPKWLLLTLILLVSVYVSYKYGYNKGWYGALQQLQEAIEKSKEDNAQPPSKNDGEPGYLDHSRDKQQSVSI